MPSLPGFVTGGASAIAAADITDAGTTGVELVQAETAADALARITVYRAWGLNTVLNTHIPGQTQARCLEQLTDPQRLEKTQDGGMAMDAFLEALHPQTASDRKQHIRDQLLAYCKLDTYAMVRLWQVFSGRTDLAL